MQLYRALLRASLIYLSLILLGNLMWETFQLPLYTIWQAETAWQQAFAVIHCTAGDVLIAASALVVGLITVGHQDWPTSHFKRVAVVAIVIGLAYTVSSEWLNVFVRGTLSYSEWMPIVSFGGWEVGLSPLLQWSIVPSLCFVLTWYGTRTVRNPP